jgi:hypothetical protein
MQLDIPEPSENVEEPTTLTIVASSQPVSLIIPILVTLPLVEIQQPEVPLLTPIPQVPVTQSPLSTVSVEIPIIRSETPEVSLPTETGTQLVQIELQTPSGQSTTSLKEQLEPIL